MSLLLAILAALFAFVDVWYFLRFFWLQVRLKLDSYIKGTERFSVEQLMKEYVCRGIVLPSDIDFMLHMNNSKYLREMDFGRVGLGIERGLHRTIKRVTPGGSVVLGASLIRFRRSMQLFQRFTITTRIVCWDEKSLYMEQRMVGSKGFIYAINLAKMVIVGTTTEKLLGVMFDREVVSPPPPPEIQSWIESMRQSSEALRREVDNGSSKLPPSNVGRKAD